ncbi:ABC transporter substrate-binding protein [Microbacterium maritypicum]|uniref:ABC transporter substrate-binding protein n=1 Tax=Microbacterium TaxID=33882 RepID=UPI0004939A2F|nr:MULTISPECIES: sugar ABC transporter substrate-binding protein [Microbacterium]MCV0336350.1 sugar ABC transporter substrate-binding protein [Microbacterium sp.]MCV0376712.1 sugar ABC transporter substrate-binding protein [Microbacterium sp.]MCV0391461.1 sugar ABC transporter substrate-binding protein [Microbacterium sp.]MCV0420067.1 sugar ABC transporter substrate-binding protein [Microbacterium sp.]MCV0423762.1 sugar ABC transporter substrate-binding protein [Microbacterium sp.]
MKKKLTGIAALAAVGIALAGCATGGVPTGGSDAVALDPDAKLDGEITVWSWDVGAVALERLAADFEKAHEGTTVKVVDVGYDNAYDKMSVGFQAGTGLPDVVTIETDAAPGYITQFPKGMLDLNPILGGDEVDFDPFKWSAGSDADGSLRIAPWDSGTVALYYRTDIVEQAGVDIEAAATWDDLIAAGKVIKEKTGHTLLSTDLSAGGGFQMLLQQLGQGLFNEAGEITLDSPEAVRVLTMLQEMNEAGLIKNVTGWDGRVTSAKDGDSAVTADAVWWIGTLQGDAPELSGKYAVLPLPAFDEGGARTSNNGGSGLAVPAQAKNPQLAAAFVDFVLADADNQVSMMTNEGLFPSYLPALESDYFSKPVEYFGGQPVYETFAELTAQIPPIVYTSDSAEASDIVANAVAAAVLNGADPATVLADAAAQLATSTGREVAK